MANTAPPEPIKVNVHLASDFAEQEKLIKDRIHVYKTTSKNRGVVKIINIYEVPNESPRYGSDIDENNLECLFTQMGFKVDKHPRGHYSKQEIINALKSFVTDDRLATADIAILFIMGHGDRTEGRDYFYTNDYPSKEAANRIFYDDLRSMFNNKNCKHMHLKPKMIFLQMCRGCKPDTGVHLDGHTNHVIPTSTDLLLACATTPGNAACRWPDRGSLFIIRLCEEFMQHSYNRDVATMLDNFYKKMSEDKMQYGESIIMQAGEYLNNTFGKCFLHPGIYKDNRGITRSIATDTVIQKPSTDAAIITPKNEVLDMADSVRTIPNIRKADVGRCLRPLLHDSVRAGNDDECLKLLKISEQKAMINAKDENCFTPLHWAAYYGYSNICLILIQNGADMCEKNDQGDTALHLAASKGHCGTYQILKQQGANDSVINNCKMTPWQLAQDNGLIKSIYVTN